MSSLSIQYSKLSTRVSTQRLLRGTLLHIIGSLDADTHKLIHSRALHPLIDRRDTLEIAHANLSTTLQTLLKEAAILSADNLRAMDKNRALTVTLLALAKKVQAQRDEVTKDPKFGAQLDEARNEAATARQRWRLMKSVVAAVVAGSGVDWARDDTLRDLVLDEETEAD